MPRFVNNLSLSDHVHRPNPIRFLGAEKHADDPIVIFLFSGDF